MYTFYFFLESKKIFGDNFVVCIKWECPANSCGSKVRLILLSVHEALYLTVWNFHDTNF